MVNSMTGFGRAGEIRSGREISVELRSVNHRYLEIAFHLPRAVSFLEERLRGQLQRELSRGKVDVGVTVRETAGPGVVILPNIEVAKGYFDALSEISEQLGLAEKPSADTISRLPDVFRVVAAVPDEEELFSDVSAVMRPALAGLLSMRKEEGARMAADILEKLEAVEQTAEEIASGSGERVERYRTKLEARMRQLLETADVDEGRIVMEAALYADKSAVDEETVRLSSHIAQFREILSSEGPVGRKLDFLLQEINREINTIGSKSTDVTVTERVVKAKSDVEKIREQIQNIE